MILARFRKALPITLSVALLELALATLLARVVAAPMERMTGAADEPFRWLIGMIEEVTHGDHRQLGATLAVVVTFAFAYGILEPLLSLVFVRAHQLPGEARAPAYGRRYLALLLARLLVTASLIVVALIVVALEVLVHFATRGIADPRIHDLALVGLGALVLVASPSMAALFDLVCVRIAISEPRPLEASVDALHSIDLRVSLARAGLWVLSVALLAVDGVAVPASNFALSMLLAGAVASVRLGARSLYVAWLTEDATRSID